MSGKVREFDNDWRVATLLVGVPYKFSSQQRGYVSFLQVYDIL